MFSESSWQRMYWSPLAFHTSLTYPTTTGQFTNTPAMMGSPCLFRQLVIKCKSVISGKPIIIVCVFVRVCVCKGVMNKCVLMFPNAQ